MSSVGLRASSMSSKSSTGSQKRKSEGEENACPNSAGEGPVESDAKKLRSKSASSEASSSKTSGIARYQKPSRGTAAIEASSESNATKRSITEKSTAERSVTPSLGSSSSSSISSSSSSSSSSSMGSVSFLGSSSSSSSSLSTIPSTPGSNGLQRGRSRKAARTPCNDKIKTFFETTITVTEQSVTAVLAPVKEATKTTKAKYDFKETNKVLDVANKGLRDLVIKLIGQTKQVQEKCLGYENDSDSRHAEAVLKVQECIQSNAILKAAENKTRKELCAANEKIAASEAVCSQLKVDAEKVRDLESRIGDLVAKHATEQSRCRSLEADMLRKEKDLAELKQTAADDLKSAKGQYEQHAEQLVTGYKDEIVSLRGELGRRQSDVERSSNEKAELDRKSSELREEIVKMQANLREAEGSANRYEKEVQRITNEFETTREQLSQKELDLRSALNSMNEIQRQVTEERGTSRSEISALQTRIHALEEDRLAMTKELAMKTEESGSASRENARLTEAVASLEIKFAAKETELSGLKEVAVQLEMERELKTRCELREEEERRERIAACAQLLATQTDCNNRVNDLKDEFNASIENLKQEIAVTTQQREEATQEWRKQADIVMGMENEIVQLRHALENASANHESVEKLGRVTGELEILRRRMRETAELKEMEAASSIGRIKDLEEQVKNGEVQRRKLHNMIQELRGNVRVFARVRPFLPSDGFNSSSLPDPTILARSDCQSLKIGKAAKADERAEEHSFAFDRVFGPSSSQELVFQEVSEFVQSALDGYNVCLFSYGQTGSGKTHTMQGSGNGSMRGIIPRAMQQVGLYKIELESKGWEYQMEVSFIEIYNETIRDLLRANAKDDDKHEIKRDANGNTTITDVTMITVDPNDVEQMDSIMEQAARYRSVGQTLMNERSSRSHSVFCLHLRATNAAQGVVLKGALNLVDLAGSERLDRSGATGDRLKETVAINKSLSSLTDVFVAIGNKQSHIPFRNSKLTYLLQPALSGDGKTLMMVNLSPTEESYFESVCSLRFASQVNQCELGKPKRQMKDAGGEQITPATKTQGNPKSGPTSSASGASRKVMRK